MLFEELAFYDAVDLAALVRAKEVQPLELVDMFIARIEKLNPELNAVVTPMYDQARATASGRLPEGPFSGVPFLLKDILGAYAGVPMSLGCKLLAQFAPDHDAELTVRLKKAGLVIMGRTNCPEFGLLPTTEPELFGPARNPWDTARTTGGSSGGSAAAVAAGLAPMAHANDGGGSIRIPASCCGLFGLKPTRGRNPLGPDFGDSLGGLVAEHAVTRSVRDSAILLDAVSGPDVGDPYWAPPPARPFSQEVGADPGRLRVAFSAVGYNDEKIHPDCRAAVEKTAALLSELGHEVTEARPEINYQAVLQAFTVVWTVGCASTIEAIVGQDGRPEMFEPFTWYLYEQGKGYSGADYLNAVAGLQAVSRRVASFFLDYDVWMSPTVAEPPVPLGTFSSPPHPAEECWERTTQFCPFTPIFNATGQPAMSVPLHWTDQDLPVGVHFAGRFGDEAGLIRLASQLEAAKPWANRRPSVS